MSALPAAVRKQVDRANQLAEEALKGKQGEVAPAPTPPAAETPPTPAPAAVPAAETPPPAASDQQPPTESWEQKYRVLQGKYNAEVPRLQAQVRELIAQGRQLQDQVVSTQSLLASLGARQAAPADTSTPQPPAASSLKLVKDEEVREYGADLIDVMRRVARETLIPEFDQRLKPVVQKVDQATQAVANTAQRVAQSDEQKVLALLTEQVPGWVKQNEDEAFLDWLEQLDPYSGTKRGDLLQQAYKRHDGPRVVAIFKGYLNEHAAVTPPTSAPPAAAAQASASPQRKLEEMVAPGTSRTGTAGAQDGAGKRIWTAAEIKGFYHQMQTGKYRNKADEARKIELDIFNAQREGRIRP